MSPSSPTRNPPDVTPGSREELVRLFEKLLEEQGQTVEDLPALEQEILELQARGEARVQYSPEDLLALYDSLDELLLHSHKSLAEIFRTLSHLLKDFFKSKYVEFLSLKGDELVYEYLTAPAWMLNLTHRITGITAVLGMRIPLFEGSIFKELIDGARPRELITFDERLRSMKDFIEPNTPENIRLRERYAALLMRLFGYRYVFQVPLVVNNRVIGYYSFLQNKRLARRVRADIVLLSNRISHLILLKQREEERRHFLSEGMATLEAIRDRRSSRVTGFLIKDVNPALLAILGLPRQSLVNRPLEAMDPELQRKLESLTRVLHSHVPTSFEVRLRGGQMVCRFLVSRTESEDLIVVIQDISEQIRADQERQSLKAQILHAQKLESLGVLAGGIAHDFNNLLVAMLANAELALTVLPPFSPAAESLQDIRQAARRAADLTSQLLAYSGKGQFLIVPVDLTRVVREIMDLLRVSVSKKARLDLRLADNLPPIAADRGQINQVVMNLITNASEALGSEAGVIGVTTGTIVCDRAYLKEAYLDDNLPQGTYVFLEVADSGCGMDEALQQRIFDPFFSTKFTGRGLGLAAVMGIVRSHKGAIRIRSTPGRGTVFTVLFPQLADGRQVAAEAPPVEPRWRGTGTVMLVDDEQVVRDAGKRMLEHMGFSVILARDGEEAVRLFWQHRDRICCVVMDQTMPVMDGHEATRKIRRIHASIPVLLCSGYSLPSAMERPASGGLSGFIQKPFGVETLRARLQEILQP